MQANDQQLIEALLREEHAAFHELYDRYFPVVRALVLQNSGSAEDAEDLFQDTALALLSLLRKPDFLLSASLKTLVYSIGRNLWLKELRSRRRQPVAFRELPEMGELPSFAEQVPEAPEQRLQHWLARISAHCQRVLTAIFLHNQPMEALMRRMGWKNRHTAANQQYKCLLQARRLQEKES